MNTKPEAVSNGLAIVSIPVKDQEKSKRFYNDFGAREKYPYFVRQE